MNVEAAALLARARRLAGLSLTQLEARADGVAAQGAPKTPTRRGQSHDVPRDGPRGKGFVGQWVERALGLKPRFDDVDDPVSGTEVKTLPVRLGHRGARVLEGTFVTTASVERLIDETWANSRVRRKLARVLFVPVVSGDSVDGVVVGTAFLWEPSAEAERQLQADWEDLSDLVTRGLGFAVSGRRGVYLQLRPKAKDASAVTTTRTVDDDDVVLRPQGFYLRRRFTQRLLDAALQPPTS